MNHNLPNMPPLDNPAYNINRWSEPVYTHASVHAFALANDWPDGIHHVEVAENQYLDVLIKGLSAARKSGRAPAILVGLSAAIFERQGKQAPFFSGINISDDLGLPFVSISDPTLAIDDCLGLSWYAGNERIADLPTRISQALDAIGKSLSLPLIIFGGSGAGFASLILSTMLNVEAKVLVWNPQTIISAYNWRFVVTYLSTAFPSFYDPLKDLSVMTEEDRHSYLHGICCNLSITHEALAANIKDNVQVVYLQNNSDTSHILYHAKPYFAPLKWKRLGAASFASERNNIGVFIGNWGDGHAALPRKVLIDAIRLLIENNPAERVVDLIERSSESLGIRAPYFHWFTGKIPTYIRTTATIEENCVHASCLLDDGFGEPSDLKFAFYLTKSWKTLQVRWYSTANSACFSIEDPNENYEVVSFVENVLGEQVMLGSYPVQQRKEDL